MTDNIRSGEAGWDPTPRTLSRDSRLSYGARGLAVDLLSHVDGYRSDEAFLVQCTTDGRDAVRGFLAELRRYGYLIRKKVNGPDGRLVTVSVMHDTPQWLEARPPLKAPTRGKPASRSDQGKFAKTGSPTRGKPASRSDQGESAKSDGSPDAGNPRVGPTRQNTENPLVRPTRGEPATRSDQQEHDVPAGHTDTRETRVYREQQGGEQKNISQSARERQAARHLRKTYNLTDHEVRQVITILDERATRTIDNLTGYMINMAEGDLADIIAAIWARASQERAAAQARAAARAASAARVAAAAAATETHQAPKPPPPWPLPVAMDPFTATRNARDKTHADVCNTDQCPRCEAYRKRTAHAA